MNVTSDKCKPDNTGGWTLKPQQLILYCSSRGINALLIYILMSVRKLWFNSNMICYFIEIEEILTLVRFAVVIGPYCTAELNSNM